MKRTRTIKAKTKDNRWADSKDIEIKITVSEKQACKEEFNKEFESITNEIVQEVLLNVCHFKDIKVKK